MKKQTGSVLLVSMFLLLAISILATSSVSTSNSSLQVVNNMQVKREADEVVDRAIEQTMSDITKFTSPAIQIKSIKGYTVLVNKADCLGEKTAYGYSGKWALAPKDTYWSVAASVADPKTGAQATVTQGVTIRLPADFCP